MKLTDILKSASSSLWRNKGRTILTIIAIFIGAFTISLTTAVNIGVNDYIDKQIGSVGGEDQLMISAFGSLRSADRRSRHSCSASGVSRTHSSISRTTRSG